MNINQIKCLSRIIQKTMEPSTKSLSIHHWYLGLFSREVHKLHEIELTFLDTVKVCLIDSDSGYSEHAGIFYFSALRINALYIIVFLIYVCILKICILP